MFDILVIGAGPTGLVSALTFAKSGYEVAVIDPVNRAGAAETKYSDRSPDLRTTAHLSPTVEFLKNLGELVLGGSDPEFCEYTFIFSVFQLV